MVAIEGNWYRLCDAPFWEVVYDIINRSISCFKVIEKGGKELRFC